MSATATEHKTAYYRLREERPLGDLFSKLTLDLRTLIRQEMMLARVEIKENASKMSRAVAFLAAGGVLAYSGFLVLLAALVLILAEFMAAWLSALIVGALVVAAGYLLLRNGQTKLKEASIAPQETIETIKEDVEWMKEQAS